MSVSYSVTAAVLVLCGGSTAISWRNHPRFRRATRFRISLPARQFTFTYSFHNSAQFDYTKALIVAIANPKVVR